MRVLIVAKTRMAKGACIGAITETGESVRLIPFNADPHDGANREYNVGEIWEITAEPMPETSLIPPHIEDIVVHEKSRLHETKNMRELVSAIELLMPPKIGHPRVLYEGLLQNTEKGRLHITKQKGIPSYSTTFWRTDQPLSLDIERLRPRYRYPTENGGCTFTFGGLQEPLEVIPADTLLRVSLAHWWRPDDELEVDKRCYAQISGWFLEEVTPIKPKPFPPKKPPPPQMLTQTPSEILKDVFKFEAFRPFQEDIIKHILNGQDALVVLPTGGGKSLCYQLPALIFKGLTVVVSPLISLMQDQVMKMEQRDIPAAFINNQLSNSEKETTMQRVTQGEVKLLYMAPETLVKSGTLLKLDRSNVSCLAIDEAHCISQWGHDFRPDYRELVSIRERFSSAVCVALTATATPRVQDDIKQLLGIHDENTFIASFDRENLFITVDPKVELLAQTLAFLCRHSQESGIIYCQTIKQVTQLCRDLTARRISVLPYHADLDDETRKQNQEAFINGNIQVIVATIAFGMGIDKADVRFVLHTGLPKEPESYYQEIGRSGRDGLPADCLMLFSYGDVDTINYFIGQGARSETRGRQQRLQALVAWATSIICRRKGLLSYFGEEYERENCGMCDNCRRVDEQLIDLTIPAQKFLSCVVRTDQMFGETYIIDVLRGSQRRRILDNRHDRLSTYGIGTDYSKAQWRYLSYQFIQQELLARDVQHGSLSVTQKGWGVLKSGEQILGFSTALVDSEISEFPLEYSPELFELLRAKRNRIAKAEEVQHYVIFHDKTLQAMATYFPTNKDTFKLMYGVGPAKTEKYANTFLPIIRDYCKKHGINSIEDIPKTLNAGDAKSEQPSEYSPELFELLQTKRDKIAKAKGVLPYEVFHDEAIKGMATYFPISEESFKPMSGVGPNRSERYADDFLPIIRDYCKKHGIDSTAEEPETLDTSEATSERQSGYSQELFEQLQDKCKILENAEQEGIFTDGTLKEMATSFPRTREAFKQIRGVSLRKMEKYADEFLLIIRDYCQEHGINSIEDLSKPLDVYEAKPEQPSEYSPELFELLQAERDKIVETEGQRVYEVFHDKALQAMATYFPTSEESFRQMSNVEPERFKKYADIFFPIILAYCQEHGINSMEIKNEDFNTNDATSKEQIEYAQDLYEQLQEKCRILAKAEQKGIFTNRTLREMAIHFPRTQAAFRRIHGVGPKKTENMQPSFYRLFETIVRNMRLI